MQNNAQNNDLQQIITQALDELKREQGEKFDPDRVNLAELARRTGLSRSRLRTLKENGFEVKPHGLVGRKAETTILTGYTGVIDGLLRDGVKNSTVCYDRIREQGYQGSQTVVRDYIRAHQHLLPPKRQLIAPQGNRGRRYETGPGESFQMDWGFVEVVNGLGSSYKVACFAMICHHCGERYVEFFPNAKQENLFIGMIHALIYLGIPRYVLTDNL